MASITLAGSLLDPDGFISIGDQVRFTHKSNTGQTIKSAVSIITIPPSGNYNITLQYGLVKVDYKDILTNTFTNLGVVTVNQNNPATTLPELLNAAVPPSSQEMIEFQAILADCVTQANNAATSATEAEQAVTDIDALTGQQTTTELINSSVVYSVDKVIETSGFTTSGDGGSGSWKQNGVTGQTLSQTPAQLGDGLLNDASGNQWSLVSAYGARAGELGALIGNPDSTSSLSAALNGVGSSTLLDGTTTITSGVAVSSVSLYMQGAAKSKINKTTDGNALTVSASHKATIKDFDVTFTGKDVTISGHGLTIKDSDNSTIEKIKFTGVDGLGFGCFIYSDISVTNYGCSIKDTYHEGTTTDYSVANGGAMLVDAEFGLISNTRTKGITRFPVELKGNSTYCIIENSFIDDSVWGLYYGTQTADHPSYSIANNLIVKGADTSLYSGYGTHNIYHNILINNLSADGSRIGNGKSVGVKLINAENSIATNILTDNEGADLDVPLEISGTSKNNHISIAPRHSNAEVLVIGANTEKNSIEVLGMKNGTSIFATNVVNYQAPNHSGGAGNSIYNHATGERWGSFSGRFRDRLEDAASVTLFSTDTFVQDVPTDQQGRHVLTCADSQKAGYAVVTPTYRGEMQFRPDLGGGWQLSGGGGMSYRWDSSSFRTLNNNVASLGESGALFTEVFAANGTINTSDERKKTELLNIDAAEMAAAKEVKLSIRKFKMLDSVDKKGDDARIHFGVGAQTVKAIFEKHGLDAHDYSLFCYDEWDSEPEEKDEYGKVTYKGRESGNAYGIRYGQLAMFILATV